MNRLEKLREAGQSPWLDFVSRAALGDGTMSEYIGRGIVGVTSNPSIFEKALGGSADYDEAIGSDDPGAPTAEVFERLAVVDIQRACDLFSPLYADSEGADGYVSLEVSPYAALDTDATIEEGERLWAAVDRPNLMIKVPATRQGIPAIRALISQGVNVNVTLLFGTDDYARVAEAYVSGLEALEAAGGDVSRVASVASFFISRVDAEIEKRLKEQGASEKVRADLIGRVAVANARLAYERYEHLYDSARWERLEVKGAKPQRLLWASTSTKDPELPDTLYVDELIGPETVNTMPPKTLEAFVDHGTVERTVDRDLDGARRTMARLAEAGISIEEVVERLIEEGVQKFADSFDELLGALAEKRAALGRDASAEEALPDEIGRAVKERLEGWRVEGAVRRIWKKDASFWSGRGESAWLGWLGAVEAARSEESLARYAALSEAADSDAIDDVVLLGMGGSSLGAETIARTWGRAREARPLHVVDSTDPAQIRAVSDAIDIERTIFLVASKSGSTLEPRVLLAHFWSMAEASMGAERAAAHFIAVTDPDSKLARLARERGFAHTFLGDPSIGGRYSVLSPFGLAPAAAIGLDVGAILERAARGVAASGPDVPPAQNDGVRLGAIMGEAARAGRDKLTIIASPGAEPLGPWIEQLVAESTGKQDRGIIPIAQEPALPIESYGEDRLFVSIQVRGESIDAKRLDALADAGHPVVRIAIPDVESIAAEFFRWEMATAVAGAVLSINPFDQPDVESAKEAARSLMEAYSERGAFPVETPLWEEERFDLYADLWNADEIGPFDSFEEALKAHLERVQAHDYVALNAYLARSDEHEAALDDARRAVGSALGVATTAGFGPRFLHSTGQIHKGGPASGVFVQLTCDDERDLKIPGESYSFGAVKAAQARGDFAVLADRGRRALRVHLKGEVSAGLSRFVEVLSAAVSTIDVAGRGGR